MVYAIHWSAETVDNKYSQSPKSYPRHNCKKKGMEFRREVPKQNMGYPTWEGPCHPTCEGPCHPTWEGPCHPTWEGPCHPTCHPNARRHSTQIRSPQTGCISPPRPLGGRPHPPSPPAPRWRRPSNIDLHNFFCFERTTLHKCNTTLNKCIAFPQKVQYTCMEKNMKCNVLF